MLCRERVAFLSLFLFYKNGNIDYDWLYYINGRYLIFIKVFLHRYEVYPKINVNNINS